MANHKDIVPFFYKWEGGKSRDASDDASKYPCPTKFDGIGGWHTVKGVTYASWVGVFGKDNDDRFFEMNDEDWGLIFKNKYWDKVKGDDIKYQSIANVFVSWAWGSGAGEAIKQMQRVLGVDRDGIIGKQTIGALNSREEQELFDACIEARRSFFYYITNPNNAKDPKTKIRFAKNKKFLKGWLNRLNDFDKNFNPKNKK